MIYQWGLCGHLMSWNDMYQWNVKVSMHRDAGSISESAAKQVQSTGTKQMDWWTLFLRQWHKIRTLVKRRDTAQILHTPCRPRQMEASNLHLSALYLEWWPSLRSSSKTQAFAWPAEAAACLAVVTVFFLVLAPTTIFQGQRLGEWAERTEFNVQSTNVRHEVSLQLEGVLS